MKKTILLIFISYLTISLCNAQKRTEKTIENLLEFHKSEPNENSHVIVYNYFARNGIFRRSKMKISEDQLKDWFSKQAKYNYLGLWDEKHGLLANNGQSSKNVLAFIVFDNENNNKKLAQQQKWKEETTLAKIKLDEDAKLYRENFAKVKQQIENGAYRREQQPLSMVKNHHWWNEEELKNLKTENNVIDQEFKKFENVKPTVYKEFLGGGETVKALVHSYTGSFNTNSRLPEGTGAFKIGIGSYLGNIGARMGRPEFEYVGEWKNGQFEGEGKTFHKYIADIYCSYSGNWKNSKYDGLGQLTEAYKDGKVEFLIYDGTFKQGKKNGRFKVYGQFRDQVNHTIHITGITQNLYQKFGFKADAVYIDDELEEYHVMEDQEQKFNNYFAEIFKARREASEKQKIDKCMKCEINYKKSTYPREEDNFLWPGTSHRSGEIVMKNGDKYEFDYKEGKCKVIKGWFETDDYYDSFKQMVHFLEKNCAEKYCK